MIITSLLDTDLYKFTMMQTVLHQFPGAMAEYHFKCRSAKVDLSCFKDEINSALDNLCELSFKLEELDYLRGYDFFKSDFLDFLRLFRFSRDFIEVSSEPNFSIVIRGPWLHTILYEVPVLAMVSEIYNRHHYPKPDFEEGRKRCFEKIEAIQSYPFKDSFRFSDFGTRRRFSCQWQHEVNQIFLESLPDNFTGTSNVMIAKSLGVKAIGTMAHEYLEACQVLGPRLALSQKFAFEKWAQEYRGQLGIALSDVIGIDAFLRDFDLYFCKLFDGARHDSGDPFVWGDRLIEHYQKMRIDPKTKTLVFSDSLTTPKALKLHEYFYERTNPVFGIGTNCTNDLGHQALQIVIKMVRCNNQPVAKITDAPGKAMCHDESYISYLKKVFQVEQP